MPVHHSRLKKPFMVTNETETDFAVFKTTGEDHVSYFHKWVDWEGTKFATKEGAQAAINRSTMDTGSKVIEILEEVRFRG